MRLPTKIGGEEWSLEAFPHGYVTKGYTSLYASLGLRQ
jgi:hypothetical protein